MLHLASLPSEVKHDDEILADSSTTPALSLQSIVHTLPIVVLVKSEDLNHFTSKHA
jgi:hypothetical protein